MSRRMTVVFDDEELYTALKVEAARTHKPAKDIVSEALRERLRGTKEELEDIRIAEERISEYERTGGADSVDLEDLIRERGLD